MDLSKVVVLDTETTGLSSSDEILQVSIIDGNGITLMNKYFKPKNHHEWTEAMKFNQITPERVKDCPNFSSAITEIEKILNDCDVICGYNVNYDIQMLVNNGVNIPSRQIHDVMLKFAEIMNVKRTDGRLKWFKLCDCANFYNFKLKEGQSLHDSLTDVLATLHCYRKIGVSNF